MSLEKNRVHDFSTKRGTKDAIIYECKMQGIGLPAQIAYVLATAQWETAGTFQPVKEAYWLSENWRKRNLRYYPYYGRGFVQLTWDYNYEKYSDILGVNYVAEPDKVMDPNISLFILVHGFKNGTFTGKKITDYINEKVTDFKNARKCINGLDKWREIKAVAEEYLRKENLG